MRTYIKLTILIMIAIGSYWLLQEQTQDAIISKEGDSRFPDYFMENVSITNMNKQGQPEYILKAIKMRHYADDDSAELEHVFLKIKQDGNEITLRANRATFLKQENIVHLHDKVIIHRAPSKNQSELSIYTDHLKIDTKTHIAETNLAAQVKTPEAEINSIGLLLDNKQGIVKLQSQVKGTYEATK